MADPSETILVLAMATLKSYLQDGRDRCDSEVVLQSPFEVIVGY